MRQTGKIVINKVEKQKSPPRPGQLVVTKCQILEFLLISLNRLLMGFVCLYMCWMCLRLPLQEIPFHAVFCTIGFVCLMSEGLMAYYRANARTKFCDRSQKTKTHWILQLCGSILGLVGVAIKIGIEEKHFHSVHGIVGLITSVMLLFTLLSGLSALYAHEMKSIQPMLNKTLHNIWGLLTYTLVMLSMYTAYDTNIFIEYSLDAATYNDFKWLIQISIGSIWLLTIYGPIWCLVYMKLWGSSCC
ncbi:uncharacterized protein LOC101898948 [Musca domestica]|uniref:ascorbate ferrireductase (transmembrane) n=1 Tax=Musca domestica TaxID=7370 RepID=A0ABM3VIB9_MUSDO|nr:uncharacterized protein LOC101898948 [Musca domestica]